MKNSKSDSVFLLFLTGEEEEGVGKAYDYALFLLKLRLRTEGELREKLRLKKYSTAVVDKVISQLKEQKYLNDQRFAEIFLENLKKYKSWGYFGIKKKMMERKLPPALIERVLSAGLSEKEEEEMAKRFVTNRKLEIMNYAEKQKIAKKLAAKGFRSSVISKLIF